METDSFFSIENPSICDSSENNYMQDVCPFFMDHPDMFGDGYCDRELNNPECEYDGGDCCSSARPDWGKHCGDGCDCLDPRDNPKPANCKNEQFAELAGNDVCNNELNNPECRYDDGDCCRYKKYIPWHANNGECNWWLEKPECGGDGYDCSSP